MDELELEQELPEEAAADDIELLSVESVPMYPRFLVRNKPHRTLAYMKDYNVWSEKGDFWDITDESYDTFKSIVFNHNLLVFCNSVVMFPFLDSCVQSEKVMCNKKGVPTSIRLTQGNKHRWVASFQSWELEPSMYNLLVIRRFLDYLDVGDYPTIGAAGSASMVEVWARKKLPRHTMPNGYCESFLRSHMVGGRVDTPGLGKRYERLIEYDLTSAYLSNYTYHPTGTSVFFRAMDDPHGKWWNDFSTFFAYCIVELPDKDHALPLGPVPIRTRKNGKPAVEYPTYGTHECYLWKEQIELARAYGCFVHVSYGFGWWDMTSDNEPWCLEMFQKKIKAPDELTADLTKRAINSAIGRHAMDTTYFSLVTEENATPEDLYHPVVEDGEAYPWYVHHTEDLDSANMLHWNAYTLMLTANQVFEMAYRFAFEGRLVATNYDSVTVLPENSYPSFPQKGVDNSYPGQWTWEELTNCYIKAPRAIKCDQKDIEPGVPKEDRG